MATAPSNDRELLILLADKIDRLTKTIEGNGKTGLVDRVSDLEIVTNAQSGEINRVAKMLADHIEAAQAELDKRNTWWSRVGLEFVKTTLAIASALVIAGATKLF